MNSLGENQAGITGRLFSIPAILSDVERLSEGAMPQLIVFAGLPGSGKTTLAKLLAPRINAVILNKDDVRASLFAPDDVEYSDRQNDFCMEVIYQLAKYHFSVRPQQPVIIDGRTFSRHVQWEQLRLQMQTKAATPLLILCRCEPSVAVARISTQSDHQAKDRHEAMFWQVAERFETIPWQHITINTDQEPVDSALDRIMLAYNDKDQRCRWS